MRALGRARKWQAWLVDACLLAGCLVALAPAAAADRKAMQEATLKELSTTFEAQPEAETAPAKVEPVTAPAKAAPPATGGRLMGVQPRTGRANTGRTAGAPMTAAEPPGQDRTATSRSAVITPDEGTMPETPAAALGPGVELMTGGGGADGTAKVGRLPIIE